MVKQKRGPPKPFVSGGGGVSVDKIYAYADPLDNRRPPSSSSRSGWNSNVTAIMTRCRGAENDTISM